VHLYVDNDSSRNPTLTVENFRTTVMVSFDKHDFSGALSSTATSPGAMNKYKCDWKDA
jgi:hypothetical protein